MKYTIHGTVTATMRDTMRGTMKGTIKSPTATFCTSREFGRVQQKVSDGG